MSKQLKGKDLKSVHEWWDYGINLHTGLPPVKNIQTQKYMTNVDSSTINKLVRYEK
jgi:hypothetical protein